MSDFVPAVVRTIAAGAHGAAGHARGEKLVRLDACCERRHPRRTGLEPTVPLAQVREGGSAMKLRKADWILALAASLSTAPAWAQAPRLDAIWARRAIGTITLNGVMNEPVWAKAESMVVNFGADSGIPGSGYKFEGGVVPIDPAKATLKFIVIGNTLYMGARVADKSIGGSADFNRFDGFLMALKDRASPGFPKLPAEYFYSWWYPSPPYANPTAVGNPPVFKGRWAND